MLKIVLDPGHYKGYNKGCVPGYAEGDMTWTLAKHLKDELERDGGVQVVITRPKTESDMGLQARGKVAVACGADLFISLHSNAVGDTARQEKAYGVSVYRSIYRPDSQDLGTKLADAVVAVMRPTTGNTFSRGVLTRQGSGSWDYYGVIYGAMNCAQSQTAADKCKVKHAFIIEHGFHTNSRECAFLNDDTNLKKLAGAEAKVIKEHFGIIGDQEDAYEGLSIMGAAMATEEQLRAYLLKNNPDAKEYAELPALYLKEGQVEGVRGDAAFCQACKETGFFRYKGDVRAEQNNFCGLGATGGGNPGYTFESKQLGVRAHIQHLKAYGSVLPLNNDCVDPRFKFVARGKAGTFEELAGKWAVPGYDVKKYQNLQAAMSAKAAYGHNIVSMLKVAMTMDGDGAEFIKTSIKGNDVIGTIKVIYEGTDGLNVHKTPEWGTHNLNIKAGPVHGGIFRVTDKVQVGRSYMYKLYSGAGYITADERYVTFTPSVAPVQTADVAVKAGDTVKVLKAETYTGSTFKLYHEKYTVLSLSGSRAVIGVGQTVTAAVDVKNLAIA